MVNAQIAGQIQGFKLSGAVHDLVCARTRVTVDVLLIAYPKVARQVSDALLKRVKIGDLINLAAQCGGDVGENIRVEILQEHRVKRANLIYRIKLVNYPLRVGAHHHIQLTNVV